MDFKDYYKILGVDPEADSAEIKKAYRRLARKYHPDVNKEPEAEDQFKEVGEAYEVLKDPGKRAEYDQIRQYGTQSAGGGFEPPPGWESSAHFNQGGFTGADAEHFSDFFESIFGGGGGFRQRGPRSGGFAMRGEDLHHRLALLLEEAYAGCEKSITLRVPEVDAQGRVHQRAKTLKVKVPAGVTEGQHIRLKGQGAPGVGHGEPGDLFLEIQIAPHPHFSLDGKDVYLNLPVTPWEAALGAQVAVPTLGGKVTMKIPAGARSGQKLRLKHKGMPGKPSGDQYVVLQIAMPPKQTERSKELFEALAEEVPFNPREHLGG
ncbi:DnaJ C-terminal domain-containing protein [Marinobacteraceae bacterium S3BR75-40.1]